MKKTHPFLVLFLVLLHFRNTAQVSFTLPANSCQNSTLDIVAQATTGVNSYTWSAVPNTAVFTSPNSSTTTIVFGAATNYSVLLSTNTGTYMQSIAVAGPMAFSVAKSSPTTCIQSNFPKYSKPVKITTSGASTCTWNPVLPVPFAPPPGNPQVQADVRPSSDICYTITGFQGNCNATVQACVIVMPQFTFNVYGNFEYCEPLPAQVYIVNISPAGLSPYTYSWTESPAVAISIDSPLSAAVNLTPSQACTYTVEITDVNQCVSLPKLVAISKTTCVSLAEIVAAETLQVNYSVAQQKIYCKGNPSGTIMITDAQGKCFVNTQHNAVSEVSTEDWASGIYYCKLKNGNGEICKKIAVIK